MCFALGSALEKKSGPSVLTSSVLRRSLIAPLLAPLFRGRLWLSVRILGALGASADLLAFPALVALPVAGALIAFMAAAFWSALPYFPGGSGGPSGFVGFGLFVELLGVVLVRFMSEERRRRAFCALAESKLK